MQILFNENSFDKCKCIHSYKTYLTEREKEERRAIV